MIGAIIGDIAGSRFEFDNYRKKDPAIELMHPKCSYTDDSVMTLALELAILHCNGNYDNLSQEAIRCMRNMGRKYPFAGYGSRFYNWIFAAVPEPYFSCGNGAAMRVSGVGAAAGTLEECKDMSYKVTSVTHNHPDGIRGAEAEAVLVFMARHGASMEEMRSVFTEQYYPINFTLDEIRSSYPRGALCSNTVPQAMEAFFESKSFEDAIRNAISIGGDSDTIAAIAGGVAEAYYGVPDDLKQKALNYLPEDMQSILVKFESTFPVPHKS